MAIFRALKWQMCPPTLNMWANWYMSQWDLFVTTHHYAKAHHLVISTGHSPVQFKQPNEAAYARYREFMQIIDCAVLDIQTQQYKARPVLASLLYLLVGKYYNQPEFKAENIYENFSQSSMYLQDTDSMYNDLFQQFLMKSFGFRLIDLLPNVQYISTFFQLPMNYDLPTAAKTNKHNVLEVTLAPSHSLGRLRGVFSILDTPPPWDKIREIQKRRVLLVLRSCLSFCTV